MTKEIDHPMLSECTQTQIEQLQSFVNNVSGGVPGVISTNNPNSKVYFVGFDGTGNNRENADLAPTNVDRLTDSADKGLSATNSGKAAYYKGPGTEDLWITRKLDQASGVTMVATAKTAYSEFVAWSNDQYKANSNVEITLAGVSFSRGGGTHTAFLNEVYEKGIPDKSSDPILNLNTDTGLVEIVGYTKYIIPPGEANLGVQVFYDRVVTGGRSDVTTLLPPSDKLHVLSVLMNDERRMDFAADSLQNPNKPDPRVTQVVLPGAHPPVSE